MTPPPALDLNLKQLKTFYFVAKHLSFTRAARDLFVTQPAVTMQIDALEQHCETRFFSREKKHLKLTEAGAVLFRYAEQIVGLAREAEQAICEFRINPHGVLRIGTTKTFARYLMAPLILHFHQAHPKIRILLNEGSSKELAAALTTGAIDLAVVGRVPYDSRLEATPFPHRATDEMVVALAPGHPLAGAGALSLVDIQREPLLLREKGSGTRHLILQRFQEQGLSPNILLEASNVDFIKDLVERGAGIGILGRMSVEDDLRRGSLVAVPLTDEGFRIHIDLLLPREGYRPVAARAFLAFLLEGEGAGATPGGGGGGGPGS
jgi:DNA-binding transcriptional LysR family regulator